MKTTFIKIVTLMVMSLTSFTVSNAQTRRERFNLTADIDDGSSKITVPINSYNYSFTNFKDRKDSSENAQHIYHGYFMILETKQETNLSVLRMLESGKKLNITIISKDNYSEVLSNRKFEFKIIDGVVFKR
jgi:hypothetical protein